jgi:hypothetical protein
MVPTSLRWPSSRSARALDHENTQVASMSSLRRNLGYTFQVADTPRGPLSGRMTEGVRESFLGPAPNLTWIEHTPEPWKLYARVTLTASAREDGNAANISFLVERGVLTMLRAGDVVHVAASPALALSILRDDILIAAAGAATTLARMPLGRDVTIRFPDPAVVRPEISPGARYRPEDFPARPLEILIAGARYAMWHGRPTLGPYEVFVRRGIHDGEPRMSIEMAKVCPQTAAHTSAQLMDRDGYTIVER